MKSSTTSRQHIGELRRHLLYERFGFRENPFGATPNPRYLYESKTHRESKSSLIVGVECGVGFQALIAKPGMGKTTILRYVLQRFQDVARTAFLFQFCSDAHDFLSYLFLELEGKQVPGEISSSREAINQLLLAQFRAGRPVIVVVDEAQNLNLDVLEALRLLSNFETASEKMLHIILAGQPQLGEKLNTPELVQLRQRIAVFSTLAPFSLEETSGYIAHRLSVAGYSDRGLFTPDAVKTIWKHSEGVPRNINVLCLNSLLLASSDATPIGADIIAKVIEDRNLPMAMATAPPPSDGETAANGRQKTSVEYSDADLEVSASADPVSGGEPGTNHSEVPTARLELVNLTTSADPGSGDEAGADRSEVPTARLEFVNPTAEMPKEESAGINADPTPPAAQHITPQASPAADSGSPEAADPDRLVVNTVGQSRISRRLLAVFAGCICIILLAGVLIVSLLRHRRLATVGKSFPAPIATNSPPLSEPEKPAELTDIKHFSTTSSTTVAIALQHEVRYKCLPLGSPDRIYCDLKNTLLVPALTGKSMPVSELAISKIRVAQHEGNTTRITLVTKRWCSYTQRFASDPTQLVIQVRPRVAAQ